MTAPGWLALVRRKFQYLGIPSESRDRSLSRRRSAPSSVRRTRRLSLEALEERTLLAASVTIGVSDDLAFVANTTSTIHVSYSSGIYTISDNAEVINVTNNGTGTVTGNGTNTITVSNTTSLDIDVNGTTSSVVLDSTGNQTATLHDTTGGGDFFQIGSGGSAQGVLGAVIIGSTTSGSFAAVDDQTDPTGRSITVSSTTVTGLTPSTITLTNSTLNNLSLFLGTGTDTTTVTGTAAATTLQGNTLGDTVNVQGTDTGKALTVGGIQAETINIGSSGSVQGILSAVTISNNNNGSTITVDDSSDSTARTVNMGSITLSGLAPAPINFFGAEPTTIKGGTGGNTFTITGTPGNSTTLFSGLGADTVNIQGTNSGKPLTVHGQAGSDIVTIASAGSLLSGIQGAVTLDNAAGLSNLTLDDSADAAIFDATITGTQVWGFAPTVITYANLGSLTLFGGSGGNGYIINNNGTNAFPTSIVAGSGNDTFELLGTANLGTGGTLDGGDGSDTLDYTGYTGAFTVNLLGGTATGTSGISHIENVNPENAPVAVDDAYTTLANTTLTKNASQCVLANDTDANGNQLTAIVVSQPTHGIVTLNSDGSFTYTPTSNYSGPDSFTYKANDGILDSNSATVNLTVNPLPSLTVTVFRDYDANGVQDSGEVGLVGMTVYLDLNSNGQFDTGEPTQVTDASGQATFSGLIAGNYLVRQDLSATPGVALTNGADAGLNVNVTGPTTAALGDLLFSPALPVSSSTLIYGTANHDANTAYVEGLYRSVLNRDADMAGLTYWVSQLNGNATRDQVVQAFLTSAEHRGLEVDAYYQTFLHRAADAAGRDYWVNQFLAGADEATVLQGFLTSAEFQAAHADDTAFIQELYLDLLGRSAEQAGLDYWVGLLNSGTSRASVVAAFVRSAEVAARAVDGFYAAYLHRATDPAGSYWLDLWTGGVVRLTDIAAGYLTSDEFFSNGAATVS